MRFHFLTGFYNPYKTTVFREYKTLLLKIKQRVHLLAYVNNGGMISKCKRLYCKRSNDNI